MIIENVLYNIIMRIVERKVDKKLLKKLEKETGLDNISLTLLMNRGFDDEKSIREFLEFKASNLRKVSEMKDCDAFLNKLIEAIQNKKHITIYGDYDCDGIMGTFIFYQGIWPLNHNVHYFINHRFKEGYGMNINGVKRLLNEIPETELIVTVDNGIMAHEGIGYALDQGVDVIVSDHHTQVSGSIIVPTVCEGRQDESEELKEYFTGAELARRLVCELYYRLGLRDKYKVFLQRFCAYSGFTIVSDSVPLTPANHYIAKQGLWLMNQEKTDEIWKILKEVSGIKEGIDEDVVGFTFAPMFNATSRVTGDCSLCVDTLIAGKNMRLEECRENVLKMKTLNEERKEMTKSAVEEAEEIIRKEHYEDDGNLVIKSEHTGEGIIGIVAGQLAEKYQRVSICLCPVENQPGLYKGSARTNPFVPVLDLLVECKDLLENFGGHALAAGLTIREENIDAFRNRLNEINGFINDSDVVMVDLDFRHWHYKAGYISKLEKLKPFGASFEPPVLSYRFEPKEMKVIKDVHLKIIDNYGVNVMYWNKASEKENLVDMIAIGTPQITYFNGKRQEQFIARKIY